MRRLGFIAAAALAALGTAASGGPDAAPAAARPEGLPPSPPSLTAPAAPDSLPAANAFVEGLSRNLARAASQGLLEPADGSLVAVEKPGFDATEGDGSFRIRTAVDVALEGQSSGAAAIAIASCMNASELDFAAWLDGKTAVQALSERRRDLVRDLDDVDPGALLDLARIYIALTFGAEARAIIGSLPESTPDRLLLEVASIVDLEFGAAPTLAEQENCGPAFSLWSFLGGNPPADGLALDDLLVAFEALPLHLRAALSGRFEERLADVGATEMAAAVARGLARSLEEGDPRRTLSETRLATAPAPAGLEDLSRSLHPEAGSAVLAEIERRVAAGQSVPRDVVDTAEIMAVERRGTPEADAFRTAEVAARIANGEFAAAYAKMMREAGAPGLVEAHSEAFVAALTATAGDADFALVAFEPDLPVLLGAVGRESRAGFLARLETIGFGPRAAELDEDSAPPRTH